MNSLLRKNKVLEELKNYALKDLEEVFDRFQDEREVLIHYITTLKLISSTYLSDTAHAVIMADVDEEFVLASLNASEVQMSSLLERTGKHLMDKIMEDAPSREMFN
jgi:hypothetical protein